MTVSRGLRFQFTAHEDSVILDMRRAGFSGREIGLSLNRTASAILARLRRLQPTSSYKRVCVDCGLKTSKTGLRGTHPLRCPKCASARELKLKGERRYQAPPPCVVCGRDHPEFTDGRRSFKGNRQRPPSNRRFCGDHCYLEWRRRKKYGLPFGGYAALLKAQGGKCALCAKPGKLVIDHCHETGLVRGLLCIRCNGSLGVLGDTPERISILLAYVSGKLTPKEIAA